MKFSTDRILTTHTGSLPRPPDLVAMLNSKELGESYDRNAYPGRIRRAVFGIVRQQVETGIDIIAKI
jgi:5-methyltetrahydropteroyltriglutamate--homocysteine methyltransferase